MYEFVSKHFARKYFLTLCLVSLVTVTYCLNQTCLRSAPALTLDQTRSSQECLAGLQECCYFDASPLPPPPRYPNRDSPQSITITTLTPHYQYFSCFYVVCLSVMSDPTYFHTDSAESPASSCCPSQDRLFICFRSR